MSDLAIIESDNVTHYQAFGQQAGKSMKITLFTPGPTSWLGPYWAATSGGLISSIHFGAVPDGPMAPEDPLGLSTVQQVFEFLHGDRRSFDLPLDWSVLPPAHADILRFLYEEVPWGQVVTYGELASMAGYPGAARAAGTACRHNPFAIVVPAHRVIAAGNRLGGYAGRPDIKLRLLAREGLGPFVP
jgi:O-6-methylguanine DNA methyltransferase